MITLSPQLLQDPILLLAAFIALTAIGVLVWAAMNWQKLSTTHSDSIDDFSSYDEDPADAPPPVKPMESAGLFEAQLQEITAQLSDIRTRICAMETAAQNTPVNADTTMSFSIPPDLEKTLRAMETKIEALSSPSQGANTMDLANAVARLEGKLEGIHRLLILLTDSGDSAK